MEIQGAPGRLKEVQGDSWRYRGLRAADKEKASLPGRLGPLKALGLVVVISGGENAGHEENQDKCDDPKC